MVDVQGKVAEWVYEERSQVRVRSSEEMKAEAAEWRVRERERRDE